MGDDDDVDALQWPETAPPDAWKPAVSLDPLTLDWIGQELKDLYDEVLREPVPDRLLALLDPALARRRFH